MRRGPRGGPYAGRGSGGSLRMRSLVPFGRGTSSSPLVPATSRGPAPSCSSVWPPSDERRAGTAAAVGTHRRRGGRALAAREFHLVDAGRGGADGVLPGAQGRDRGGALRGPRRAAGAAPGGHGGVGVGAGDAARATRRGAPAGGRRARRAPAAGDAGGARQGAPAGGAGAGARGPAGVRRGGAAA